jgi:hypothetical protein
VRDSEEIVVDFKYSTKTTQVYHVILSCPDARDIKKKHAKYGEPPASENRRPCEECLKIINEWLAAL